MSPGMFFLFPSDGLTRGLLLTSSVLYIISQLNNSHQLIQEVEKRAFPQGSTKVFLYGNLMGFDGTRKQESFGNPTR